MSKPFKDTPKEVIICLSAESKKSEFVNWKGQELREYYIKIPTWISETYLKDNLGFCVLKFSKKSMFEKMQEQNRQDWKDFVEKRWSKRLTDMRKLNNGYMKIMTELSPRCFFDTHEGYIEYHKELKKLNEKYMRNEVPEVKDGN